MTSTVLDMRIRTRAKTCQFFFIWTVLPFILKSRVLHFRRRSSYFPLTLRSSEQTTKRPGSSRLCWLSALPAVPSCSETQHPAADAPSSRHPPGQPPYRNGQDRSWWVLQLIFIMTDIFLWDYSGVAGSRMLRGCGDTHGTKGCRRPMGRGREGGRRWGKRWNSL